MDAATAAALLRHVGLDPTAPPPPTREGLATVHRAYVSTVPYEAISVQLGECEPLDATTLAQRVLTGRGGYCFEVNTVLHALLTRLGFDVEMHQARVDPPGATNHMALVVDVEGERWIADAGLGEGSLDPLPLVAGTTTGDPFAWRVEQRDDGTWWVESHEWSSFSGFEIQPQPSALADFDPHHARLSTQPDSSFVKTLVCQLPSDDTLTTLRARTLATTGPAGTTKRVLADAYELDVVLQGVFDIRGVDGERLERLWANAARQHEHFLQRAK